MTENKIERTLDVVHQEYSNLAARLGHLLYTMHVTSQDADLIKSQMRDLNLEASAIKAKEAPATNVLKES